MMDVCGVINCNSTVKWQLLLLNQVQNQNLSLSSMHTLSLLITWGVEKEERGQSVIMRQLDH
jgi:hypothetical protein